MGDIFLEMMLLNRASICVWLESALTQLPQEPQPKVTRQQLGMISHNKSQITIFGHRHKI